MIGLACMPHETPTIFRHRGGAKSLVIKPNLTPSGTGSYHPSRDGTR